MPNIANHQPGLMRIRTNARVRSVCVVDAQVTDDRGWDTLTQAGRVRVQVVPSAEAALRIAQSQAVDLWVVNTDLPGLSGFELCSMLKARTPGVPVYLVANEYSADAEREALRQRATLFAVKPAQGELLSQWSLSTPRGL